MQTLFENRYTLTEPLVKELYRRIKLRSTYALLLYASCTYFLARTIWVLFFGGEMLPIFPILAAYALFRHFMGYRQAVRQTLGPKTAKPAQQRLSITEEGIFISAVALLLFCCYSAVHFSRSILKFSPVFNGYKRKSAVHFD